MEKLNRRRSVCVRDFAGANEKPRDITFQTFPKSVTVQEKESVEIECEILGKPTSGKLQRIDTDRTQRPRAQKMPTCAMHAHT